MSYNVNTPCGNCKKCQTTTETEGKCKDAQKIQDAVNKIHSETF